MKQHTHTLALGLFASGFVALAMVTDATAKPAIAEVAPIGPRIHLSDVVPSAPKELADKDLGPVPPPNGARTVTRAELEGVAGKKIALPDAVRVVRKMKKVAAPDLEKSLRAGLLTNPIGRGGQLKVARPPKSVEIADGWDTVLVDVPKPPRKAGVHTTSASLLFKRGPEVLLTLQVPIDIELPKEAALPEVPMKASLVLLVQKGAVEVRTKATAAGEGDVGDTIPVVVANTNKVLSVKLDAKDRAHLVEVP
ncbi:MAG: hypothetical protein IPJ34_04760 [Myxococcales bacterium]|nr:hypothetical protein [Myxococcales bacterium]